MCKPRCQALWTTACAPAYSRPTTPDPRGATHVVVFPPIKPSGRDGYPPRAANVDQARLLKGTDDPQQWATYGGSYNEQRYSPLATINKGNIASSGLAWFADYDTNQNQHGCPL